MKMVRVVDEDWLYHVQTKAFQGLKFYWLPRVHQHTPLHQYVKYLSDYIILLLVVIALRVENNVWCDEAETIFLNGLQCNFIAGDLFSYYLQK